MIIPQKIYKLFVCQNRIRVRSAAADNKEHENGEPLRNETKTEPS